MNQIQVIHPYLLHGMWVFDDENVGLKQEPFVPSAGDIINALVDDIPDAEKGFNLMFSHERFENSDRVSWVSAEGGGNVYRHERTNKEGWICPALLRYFDSPPPELYVRALAGR